MSIFFSLNRGSTRTSFIFSMTSPSSCGILNVSFNGGTCSVHGGGASNFFSLVASSFISASVMIEGASRGSPSPVFLLKSGDFFEGDLLSLDTNQVKLSSVLFGSRNFPADRLLAVTLGEPTEAPARYRVRTEDGSVIRAKSLTAGYDCIIAEELRLGKLTLGLDQLLQIERTAGTKAMSNE